MIPTRCTLNPGNLRFDLTVAVRETYDLYWSNGDSGPVERGHRGDIAQLGERGVRNAEAEGSSPSISTKCPCSSADRAAAS